MDLNGKNVVYLGGFGGIGQQCLREFLSKGIKNLAILDLKENTELLQELKKSFPTASIFYIPLDITKKENIEEAYKDVVAKMGHFDVVVNGCGILNDSLIELSVQVNLLGLIHSSLCALSYMDKTKGGRGGIIVNISSVAGLEPSAMIAAYSGTKAGVMFFTRAMANPVYYAQNGVGFITICPGCTDTTLLDDPCGKEILPYAAPLTERFRTVKRQSAADCARNLVKAVEIAKNGAVWLLDLGEMKEIEFPVFWRPVFE